jgi:hypothetical protein
MTTTTNPNQALLDRVLASSNKSKPVVATGVDGYVAGVPVKVYGIHKNLPCSISDQLSYLLELKGGKLHWFPADLLQKSTFYRPLTGCAIVFHAASPFVLKEGLDPRSSAIWCKQPAVQGTRKLQYCSTYILDFERDTVDTSSGEQF